MAAKRRKKSRIGSALFSFNFLKKKKKKKTKQASWVGPTLISVSKVLAVICTLSAIAIGLRFLEKYVKETARSSENKIYLELIDVPSWVDTQLQDKIYDIAGGNGGVRFDAQTAMRIQRDIEERFAWLDNVMVSAQQNVLRIEGRWRKPLALVRSGVGKSHYVDVERVVLDYVPLPNLPIVEITELSMEPEMPPPGEVWRSDDLAAALMILDRMGRMDRSFTPDKPLLFEIGRIDMSNFNGRKNRAKPHIVMYTKDNIEIIWGAEWGRWQQYLESPDAQKLSDLYDHYEKYGTLSAGIKYINLRDPRGKIPLPIDKY